VSVRTQDGVIAKFEGSIPNKCRSTNNFFDYKRSARHTTTLDLHANLDQLTKVKLKYEF